MPPIAPPFEEMTAFYAYLSLHSQLGNKYVELGGNACACWQTAQFGQALDDLRNFLRNYLDENGDTFKNIMKTFQTHDLQHDLITQTINHEQAGNDLTATFTHASTIYGFFARLRKK